MNNHAGWKKRLVAPLDRWVLRVADEVLALCPDEVEWVKAFEPRARVQVEKVPVFLSGEGGLLGGRAARARPEREGGVLHVLFLGRAEDPLKGVRFLERAVEEISGDATLRGDATSLSREDKVDSSSSRDKNVASPLELRVVSDHFGTAENLQLNELFCISIVVGGWKM